MLQVVEPTKENTEQFLNIINSNREYLEVWQDHFCKLHTVEDIQHKLQHRYKQIQKNEGVLFGIYHDNNLIGRIRFFNINNNNCEIGYWLIKSANGYGYMSEALSALESELFKFGFKKIVVEIDANNKKSEFVVKRAGYVLEHVIHDDSCTDSDTLVYIKNNRIVL